MKYFLEELKDFIFRLLFFVSCMSAPTFAVLGFESRLREDQISFYSIAGLCAVASWVIYRLGTSHGHVVFGNFKNPEKKPEFNFSLSKIFQLNSTFKRSMFVACIVCLLIIFSSFVYENFSWWNITYYILSGRRTNHFPELIMISAYWLLPIFVFLLLFGEKILSWIQIDKKK